MYCAKCGTELPLTARFCHKCGESIPTEQIINNIQTKSQTAIQPAKPARANKQFQVFTPTKKIPSIMEIDEYNQLVLFHTGIFGGRGNSKAYRYNEILDFELLEDGTSVAKGGLGRALIGGVLFGGVGAIVGGVTGRKKSKNVCNSLKLKITVNDMNNPAIYINLINSETKTDGLIYQTTYKSAQDALSTLQVICDTVKTQNAVEITKPSPVDEIYRYKKLLDEGIITQEEFETKKKFLLGQK